jgi:outer membrane immunogenic protein
MQKRMLALLASAALMGGPAMAGDHGTDWSGYYVGFHLGATEMNADTTRTIDTNAYWTAPREAQVEAAGAVDFEEQGFVGGFQAGYNHTWDWLVIGVEADLSFTSVDVSSAQTVVYDASASTFQSVTHVDQDWLGTLRARLGFDLQGALIYATGGLAAGNVEFTQGFSDTSTAPYLALTNEEIRTGWTAGGGIEVGAFKGSTFRVEYLYTDLGTVDLRGAPVSGNPATLQTGRADIEHNMLRAGMNWQLN